MEDIKVPLEKVNVNESVKKWVKWSTEDNLNWDYSMLSDSWRLQKKKKVIHCENHKLNLKVQKIRNSKI